MDFKDAYLQVDTLLKRWGENGIVMAGEAETDWIFKGHTVKGNKRSGTLILVDKITGEMRLFNAGRRRDRDVTRTAKPIDITEDYK